jgi:hypothetical protein
MPTQHSIQKFKALLGTFLAVEKSTSPPRSGIAKNKSLEAAKQKQRALSIDHRNPQAEKTIPPTPR